MASQGGVEAVTRRRTLYVVSVLLVLAGLAILLHQYFVYGVFVGLEDILHHEFFAFVLLALATGILCAAYATSNP